jgi:hypothetical protein
LTEPAEGLRALLDAPPSPPPVEDLHRRVEVRRRRRRTAWATAAGVAAVLAAVPLVNRPSAEPVRVIAGPDTTIPPTVPGVVLPAPPSGPTSTTIPIEFVAGRPISYRIDFTAPPGWQTLFAAADHMVVATRPLTDTDRALALLARNDSSFSAFPADGVVVVVGNDPLEAKGTMAPDGTLILPGPAYGLGPEKVLAGGVKVRRGDVPQSSVKIASYAGPKAPANRLREAETIAAGLRLIRTGDPSVRPEPPPPGSRPGLPTGTLPVPEAGLPVVARTSASGSELVLVAGQNCAYLRWADAQTSLPGYQPLAGGCGTRPSGTFIETFGQPVIVMRGPDTQPSTVVIFRTGPNLARFSARLADGRSVGASIGLDGWGLVASDGRIVGVSGTDTQGRAVPEQLVG